MMPVAMLYEHAGRCCRPNYVSRKSRGYPISYVEMGEEPDGQYMLPEDYGALYLQFATALHRVDPNLKLGGPVFEGVNEDIDVWPDAQGNTSWLGRFLDYLLSTRPDQDLAFMSFEHYPYEPCKIQWSQPLRRAHTHPPHLRRVAAPTACLQNPVFITEFNISWNSRRVL